MPSGTGSRSGKAGSKSMLSGDGHRPLQSRREDPTHGATCRAALYTFSGGLRGVNEQVGVLRDFASAQGWVTVSLFNDIAEGNGNFGARPERDHLMRRVAHREVDVIVAVGAPYVARSLPDLLGVLAAARLHGVRIITLEDELDTSAEAGRHLMQALDLVQNLSNVMRADSARSGVGRARIEGRRLGRPPIDEQQRIQAAALLADGVGANEVARRLNLSRSTVSRIKVRPEL